MAEQKDVLREAQSREKFKTMIGGQALIAWGVASVLRSEAAR